MPRETLLLDRDWRFHCGDVPAPLANKHLAAYMANKAGYARGAARGNFDDSDWRDVNLPHDWSVEGPFDQSNLLNQGYLPRGVGWYRRYFSLDESERGQRFALRFDGIATHAAIFVNGHCLGRSFCGYTPIEMDFTDVATFGSALNCVSVFVDASMIEGWWYEGAGIYRHAWLIKRSPVHIVSDGVFVRTEKINEKNWRVSVQVEIQNQSRESVDVSLNARIQGSRQASHATPLNAGESCAIDLSFDVDDPALWSIDSPNLHTLVTELCVNDSVVDSVSTRFGFRTIRFDSENGFFLNDQPVKLLGTCNHQDHAGLGVALPDSMHRFRIGKLKEMGSNAYRCAHNPPAPGLLDACDELGMLVMDENRNFGSSPEHLAQLSSMVRRDRNHPSVICWSICNEEAIQGTVESEQIAQTMADAVRAIDPTRPVTAAVSGGILNDRGIINAIDLLSINYQAALYDPLHAKRPNQCIIAAETGCTLGTRGAYQTDATKQIFDCRDVEHATWGSTAQAAWEAVVSRPFVAGLFVWTGFDYRGEPAPHEWPSINSHWGLLDTCGFPKDGYWLHKAWFAREPFVQLSPHWNSEAGLSVTVIAYSNAQRVELFLNDRSLGFGDGVRGRTTWTVPFEPGRLRAVATMNDGRSVEATVETAGPAVALKLERDPSLTKSIVADGEFAFPVTVSAVDSAGRFVPTCNAMIEFLINGPGRILGVGNGDPNSHEPDKAARRSLFNGLAQVIVQTIETAGEIQLRASFSDPLSPDLEGEGPSEASTEPSKGSAVLAPHPRERWGGGMVPPTLIVQSESVVPRPAVPSAVRRWLITDWRMSPITSTRSDPLAAINEGDVNSWERITPAADGQLAWQRASGWAQYRARFKPPRFMQSDGGRLVFHRVVGDVELYLGNKSLPIERRGEVVHVPLPPLSAEEELVVLMHKPASGLAGLCGEIEIMKIATFSC